MKTTPLLGMVAGLMASVSLSAAPPSQHEIDTGITQPSIASESGASFTYQVPAAEVERAMENARKAHASGIPFKNGDPFLHLLFFAGPNMVSIENRPSPAPDFTLHKTQYELFYVLSGKGVMYTGGTLIDPKGYDEDKNAGANEATGGVEVPLVKGDVLMIPPSTVHRVTQSDGALVLLAVHMPAVDGSATAH